eukprot:316796-Rhodomonas_salina.1
MRVSGTEGGCGARVQACVRRRVRAAKSTTPSARASTPAPGSTTATLASTGTTAAQVTSFPSPPSNLNTPLLVDLTTPP